MQVEHILKYYLGSLGIEGFFDILFPLIGIDSFFISNFAPILISIAAVEESFLQDYRKPKKPQWDQLTSNTVGTGLYLLTRYLG